MTARHNVRRSTRGRDALLGAGYLVLAGVLLLAAMAVYAQVFTPSVDVDLETTSIGNALQKGSDVKLNGVPVGQVRAISPAPGGATVRLAIDPQIAAELPAGTTARLLPKTLFGERYVALVPASDGAPASGGGTLADGGTIRQDRSNEAIELEQVFDDLLPVLQALKPHKLQATLAELAATLRGQGDELGDSLAAWRRYLTKLNPEVETMTDDLAKLGTVTQAWSEAAPDLLDALDTIRTSSATLVDRRTGLSDLYASVVAASDETEQWMTDHRETVIVLSARSRRALDAVRPYAAQFPCVLAAASEFIPVMDRTLGKGTSAPGIRVNLKVSEHRGRYVAGRDRVRYESGGTARCPYTTGKVGSRPASDGVPRIAAPPKDVATEQAADGLGPANSPGENQLIAELMAGDDGLAPQDYPGWASLLIGPALRGTEVSLS